MSEISFLDLDRYIGWTLVSVGLGAGGIVVRFRSSIDELADVTIAVSGAPVRLSEAAVVMTDESLPTCPKSPTGLHAWRQPILSYSTGVILQDRSQPKRCILCDATATVEAGPAPVPQLPVSAAPAPEPAPEPTPVVEDPPVVVPETP
jgi:hypothetical protein